ncbi:unnamed protein product [Cuscuta epithymum]|uniref:SWIM-type domain-containing protein n=1 Tax=Cuscuta epithymum TaxID=186058 RepID=A0AAV0FDS6_9ASTE|nr:unnamed protein product [Cuscuta epithymum]
MLHGSVKDHYNKIGRYIEELRRSNERSTFELLTIPSSPDVFRRMFVCFEGLKDGFISGCRRFVCLDGCFLKTFLGGMLLAAIGRDGNNQMFPICWAVVEGENRDSWEWFLTLLKSQLNGSNGEGWTFMSDQQKGLLAASSSVFPRGFHRNCARHIYANWNKMHKGDELKLLFWKAVKAYNKADFEEAIQELKGVTPRGADDLLKQNPKVFCRSFFPADSKCDVVVNNMAETFNGYILKARGLHIIDMLDTIMTLLMERMVTKQGLMEGKEINDICPRVKVKLEEEKVKAWQLTVTPSTLTLFKVRDYVDAFKVDIQYRACTCKKWDLTGIPCRHAIACLSYLKVRVEDYVDDYYKKGAYLEAYQGHITPCVSEKFWPKKIFPLDPPPVKAQPGRPKKK